MACSATFEDSKQDLQEAHREMLEYEIMFSALERTAKNSLLNPRLKKQLLFLMSVGHDDEHSTLIGQDDNEFNLLGLPQDIISQLTSVDFTSSELQLIKDVFVKELSKVTKEISDNVIEFDSSITSGLDICKIAQDLQKLEMDVNAEIKNLVECQNEFIDLKYKNILGKQIKKAEAAENDLMKTSQVASELYEKTLNAVYPSEECYDKMKKEVGMLENKLVETNKELEKLEAVKEKYNQLDQLEEFKTIVSQYREVMREIRMKEMALEEINASILFESTLCN